MAGFSDLMHRISWYERVKLRVLNATKRELLHDFQNVNRHGRSALSTKIVDECLDALGAEPFSMLVGNYFFGRHPDDQHLLAEIAKVAAAAYAPFLAAPTPDLFKRFSFGEVTGAPNLKKIFETTEYTLWHQFRHRQYAKFALLALPRILLRKPYFKPPGTADEGFHQDENVDGRDNSKLLWGNPAWAVAAQVARAFGKGNWCGDLASEEGGGVIRNLPWFEFLEEEGDIGRKGPTEASVSDIVYDQLCGLGFAPVCRDVTGSRAVIFEIPTTHQPYELVYEDFEVYRQPPTMLREVLVQSRVAHYIKCIVREKRAWFETPMQCERYLNRWAAKYTVPESGTNAPDEYQRPFLEADFQVVKDAGKPDGWFRVEGHVLANLAKGQTAVPVDISVPVLLKRAASVPEPAPEIIREDVQREDMQGGKAVAVTGRPTVDADPFSSACEALERLATLRRQGILDETDFLELKGAIMGRIRLLVPPAAHTAEKKNLELGPGEFAVPYAQLHAHIVDLIAEPYRSGDDPKRRAQRALMEMDEKGALNPGDSPLLIELLEIVLADRQKDVSERLAAVKDVAGKIRSKENASPASRAIAETAEQSSARAAGEYAVGQKPSGTIRGAAKIWRKLVWPDVEGAFSGGAAAATVFPALASSLPWSLQIAAAVGVVIGAGIRSGVAYGEAALHGRQVPV